MKWGGVEKVANNRSFDGKKFGGKKRKDSGGLFLTIPDPLFWTPDNRVLCDLEDVIHGSSTDTNL